MYTTAGAAGAMNERAHASVCVCRRRNTKATRTKPYAHTGENRWSQRMSEYDIWFETFRIPTTERWFCVLSAHRCVVCCYHRERESRAEHGCRQWQWAVSLMMKIHAWIWEHNERHWLSWMWMIHTVWAKESVRQEIALHGGLWVFGNVPACTTAQYQNKNICIPIVGACHTRDIVQYTCVCVCVRSALT